MRLADWWLEASSFVPSDCSGVRPWWSRAWMSTPRAMNCLASENSQSDDYLPHSVRAQAWCRALAPVARGVRGGRIKGWQELRQNGQQLLLDHLLDLAVQSAVLFKVLLACTAGAPAAQTHVGGSTQAQN